MNKISEWFDLIATFFLYIPTLLGVIFGVTVTLGMLTRNSLRKWIFLVIAVMCVVVFSQVNAAFSQVILDILLSVQNSKLDSI
jgi:hypothetical protein